MDGTGPAEAWMGFERSLRDYYGCFDVSPLESERPLGWNFRDVRAGPFHGCSISAERMYSSRSSLPENWAASGFILANFGPAVMIDHHGRTSTISAGDIVLLDSRAACSVTAYDLTDTVCLNISRHSLEQIARHDREIFGVPISGRKGTGNLLSSLLKTMLKQGDTADPLDQPVMTDVTLQLLSAALMRNGLDFHPRDNHLQVIDKMRDWAIAHIGEPWLNAHNLALEFHYSTRSLYRLFTRIGTTPSEWLWEQRLTLAYYLLSKATDASPSITEIAHATGFSDCSHFSRRFRQRFGCLPRQVQRQPLTQ